VESGASELNLCEVCFREYKALIEPTKSWLFKPLSDWRTVESHVTQMTMKFKGVFKCRLSIISLDEGETRNMLMKLM
jgi:hypothetical protein